MAARSKGLLPREGERVAVVGCGTSWFMAQAYASLRESAGQGETDAFAASEFPRGRRYDRLLAITRSGTTTEVLTLLDAVRGRQPTLAVTGDPGSAVVGAADQAIVLDFADERSVVQTRFATTTLALLRAALGQDLEPVITQAGRAVVAELPPGLLERTQFTFLGTGWTVGLANEAALKLREACSAWAEAYPAMEYRHGPISITDARSAVWFLDPPPATLPGGGRGDAGAGADPDGGPDGGAGEGAAAGRRPRHGQGARPGPAPQPQPVGDPSLPARLGGRPVPDRLRRGPRRRWNDDQGGGGRPRRHGPVPAAPADAGPRPRARARS